jgi:tetratricopeptide (TPR) repeat protein
MNTFKTITLALLLVILSVTGLRAEEISLKQFADEFVTAMQARDVDKIRQLLVANPNTAEQFQQVLARAGEDNLAGLLGKLRQSLSGGDRNSTLDRLQEEGGKAYNISDYPTALEKLQAGLEKARELGNKRYISQFLGNIGLVYGDLGQYQKALSYYQQALEIKREIGDKRGIGNNLSNIGAVYLNLGQHQKALAYFQQALEIHREISDKHGIGNNLTNIGVVYDSLGQYQKALSYFQQALEIRREIGDKRGESGNLSNIGMVYYSLGQYQKAFIELLPASFGNQTRNRL